MKATYTIDMLGRVTIPAHIRKRLDLEEKETPVKIEIEGTGIKITKMHENCVICGKQIKNEKASKTAAGYSICSACNKMIGGNNGNH